MPILPSFDKIRHYIKGLCFLGILWMEEHFFLFGFCFGVVGTHLLLVLDLTLCTHECTYFNLIGAAHVLEESRKSIVHGSSSPSLLPYHFIERKKQCQSIGNLCPRWDTYIAGDVEDPKFIILYPKGYIHSFIHSFIEIQYHL
jgi:hypothetical protein